MKKYYIYLIFLVFWLNYQNVFCACEYQGEIDQCVETNKNPWWARKITDFVCAESNDKEWIIYQIIFDMKFKEIDKDVENFLWTLQNSIQYYYWPDKNDSYINWINYINELFSPNWTLRNRYNKFCSPWDDNSIISNYIQCITGDTWQKSASVSRASTYFSEWTCENLVIDKLTIYKKVAYNLLQVNKLDFLKDFRKKQLKATKVTYDKVVSNMIASLDYITRINNQRQKVTKQCQFIAPDP